MIYVSKALSTEVEEVNNCLWNSTVCDSQVALIEYGIWHSHNYDMEAKINLHLLCLCLSAKM